MASPSSLIRILSTDTVKPSSSSVHPPRCDLSLWDLSMFSVHYIQKGHLFSFPAISLHLPTLLSRLKSSLSSALSLFYPLAGRFSVQTAADGGGIFSHIDCSDQGADFTLAAAPGLSVADVLSPSQDVPSFVRDLFPLDGAVNFDGQFLPLVAVQVRVRVRISVWQELNVSCMQVTTLEDGFFLGCAFNHAVGDGTSFWTFFNSWAEISRSCETLSLSSPPPVLERWTGDGLAPPIKLPFADEAEFIERFRPTPLREKFFLFSGEAMRELKRKACEENKLKKISSFQALSALMWRCITRARRFEGGQEVGCRLAAENRRRLRPPLPAEYFGNSIYALAAITTAGELLGEKLGWAAGLLNEAVERHTNEAIMSRVEGWMKRPRVYTLSEFDKFSVMMGSSPRFDMYGCDFGWGKAVALRSGSANKFDGKVSAYPDRRGGGGVDLEVCLPAEVMEALENDGEFLQFLG